MSPLFELNGLKINYSPLLGTISLSKSSEWITISVLTFDIWMKIIEQNESNIEISVKENRMTVKIVKTTQNYIITLEQFKVISCIFISSSDARRLFFVSKDIKEEIHLMDFNREKMEMMKK